MYSGIITAIIRFVNFVTINLFSDITYYGADTQTWTVVESGAYFLCTCLWGTRPIIRLIAESTIYHKLSCWFENHPWIARTRGVPKSDKVYLPSEPSGGECPQAAHKIRSSGSDGGASLALEIPPFGHDPSSLEAATRYLVSP